MNRILKTSEGEYRDRGSRFFAYAYPVQTKEEVQSCLLALRKKYYDARHHCYAYRLGDAGEISFCDDDGEPAHSAGDPILGQIRSRELTNVLVVVIRYFGGTLLGVRGLIEAYKGATAEALEQNEIEEIIPYFTFTLTYPYERTSEINRLLHKFPVELLRHNYTDICQQTFRIHKEKEAVLCKTLEEQLFAWEEEEV